MHEHPADIVLERLQDGERLLRVLAAAFLNLPLAEVPLYHLKEGERAVVRRMRDRLLNHLVLQPERRVGR